jgi:hypothetical protein
MQIYLNKIGKNSTLNITALTLAANLMLMIPVGLAG